MITSRFGFMGERPELLDEEEADGAAGGRQHDEDHDDDPPVAEAGGVVAPGVKHAIAGYTAEGGLKVKN